MHYLWTGNKLLECTCYKQSGKRKPKKKGFTKTASRHVSSKFFLLLGGISSMLLLQWFHSLQKIVFFLLEWPYKESLKLISQGTQLLYIWDQASEQKNQAFMAKGIKTFSSNLACLPEQISSMGYHSYNKGPPNQKNISPYVVIP